VVLNGGPGAPPTYEFTASVTVEYQLCFKCHSGFTTLLSNPTGLPKSQYALDKGIEFNPNNASYHPVEKAGTNGTDAMAASLEGTSPYKQWNFSTTSTIRCLNCHGDPSRFDATLPRGGADPTLKAGVDIAPHTSVNRGILIQPYKDRILNQGGSGPASAYSEGNFALCFVCHAEAPFVDDSGEERGDTNFRYHGLHVSGDDLRAKGDGGTSIDTLGDGQGLATCSECHFRIHSTTFAVDGQTNPARLVNFAPNVGSATWRMKTPGVVDSGSCAITCHGEEHSEDY
jgi:hypothetical protein